MTNPTIRFHRTDRLDRHIEGFVRIIANNFVDLKPHLKDIFRLIKDSREWEKDNIKTEISNWIEMFPISDYKEKVTDLVKRGFIGCRSKSELNKIRGALVEALLIGAFGGFKIISDESKYGWGAKVLIKRSGKNYNSIEYFCDRTPPSQECEDRKTVDFGTWDGSFALFFECKAHPGGIKCKEIKYMETLKCAMYKYNISHKIYFFSPENNRSIKMRLLEYKADETFLGFGEKEFNELVNGRFEFTKTG